MVAWWPPCHFVHLQEAGVGVDSVFFSASAPALSCDGLFYGLWVKRLAPSSSSDPFWAYCLILLMNVERAKINSSLRAPAFASSFRRNNGRRRSQLHQIFFTLSITRRNQEIPSQYYTLTPRPHTPISPSNS